MSGILPSAAKSKPTANLSLLHDRLLPEWLGIPGQGASLDNNKPDMKTAFLDCFVRGTANAGTTSTDRRLYESAIKRRNDMINTIGGKVMTAKTEWNFITGSGLDNPSEIGLQWHPVHGVPYWPGSSIKGMMRAYALTMAPDADAETIANLFGEGDVAIEEVFTWLAMGAEGREPAKSRDRDGRAGSLIVFDALPEKGVTVKMDVMTPHFSEWYQADHSCASISDTQAPGDWLNPVPLPFLVVPPETTFHFGLALRTGEPTLLDTAQKWLQEALEWMGGGAKTAVGYGRFYGFELG